MGLAAGEYGRAESPKVFAAHFTFAAVDEQIPAPAR
jgi:hypothetical protein